MLVNANDDLKKIELKINNIFEDVLNNYTMLGYLLKRISDDNLYEVKGYDNINEYALDLYDISSTTVSNCINVANRFAAEGVIKDEYKDYSFSKLTELLTLNDTKLLEITPDMTVKAIREFKKQLKESEELPTSDIKKEKTIEADSNVIDVPTIPTINIEDDLTIINNTLESLSNMFKIEFIKPEFQITEDGYAEFTEDSYVQNIRHVSRLDSSYSYEIFTELSDVLMNRCYYVKLDKFIGLLFVKDSKALLIKDINIINLNEVYKNKFLESTGSSFQQIDFRLEDVLNVA